MDILDPELVWINGICFRKLKIKGSEKSESKHRSVQPARNNPIYSIDDDDDDDKDYDDNLPIENSEGRFYACHNVPQCLMGFVIGKKGATKLSIEHQTNTFLKIKDRVVKGGQGISRSTREAGVGDIAIIGETRKSVADAYRRIESILYDARWKVGDYTHFISIPFNTEEIQGGFLRFKEEVLQNSSNRTSGINETMFENPEKLHLTVTMLTLFNDREIESAREILRNHRSEILQIIGNKPLCIELKGVEYMNDDPGEVDVLYGKIKEKDSDNSLQLIADKLSSAFAEVNLARRDVSSVKMHVTLIKSRQNEERKRIPFDARRIMNDFADYSFGWMTLSEIHLSVRFTASRSYYTPSLVLSC